MSCYFAPHSANKIHDMLFSLRHDITPALLHEGRFNALSGGRQVIYFSKRLSSTEFSDVFIKEVTDDNEEKAYYARSASFVRMTDESWIVLREGSMQILKSSRSDVRSLAFDQIVRPATRSGIPKLRRGDIFYDEIAGFDFVRAGAAARDTPKSSREWAQEAVKRFGFPALAIIHTMLGLELLAMWGGLSSRVRHPTALIGALIISFHLVIAVSAENIGRFNAGFAWVVVAMIVAEAGVALLLASIRSRAVQPPEMYFTDGLEISDGAGSQNASMHPLSAGLRSLGIEPRVDLVPVLEPRQNIDLRPFPASARRIAPAVSDRFPAL